jgi:hypothetical protein
MYVCVCVCVYNREASRHRKAEETHPGVVEFEPEITRYASDRIGRVCPDEPMREVSVSKDHGTGLGVHNFKVDDVG